MERKVLNHLKIITNFIVDVDEQDLLGQYLRYDGDHNLAVCVECKYALPLEWIHNHFKKNHKVKVYNYGFMEV
jgi:hypothetical protein